MHKEEVARDGHEGKIENRNRRCGSSLTGSLPSLDDRDLFRGEHAAYLPNECEACWLYIMLIHGMMEGGAGRLSSSLFVSQS